MHRGDSGIGGRWLLTSEGSHPEMHPIVLERGGEGGGPRGLNSETINLSVKSRVTPVWACFWPPSKCLLPSVLGLGLEERALLYSFSSYLTLAQLVPIPSGLEELVP